LQTVTELKMALTKMEIASYRREKSGITFARFVLFQLKELVATDRLVVSDEAVKVLDRKE
jgi:hypothetical protein